MQFNELLSEVKRSALSWSVAIRTNYLKRWCLKKGSGCCAPLLRDSLAYPWRLRGKGCQMM